MQRLNRAYADALETMNDMRRQGRMSHAERIIIELAITDRYVSGWLDEQTQDVVDQRMGGPTRFPATEAR